MQLNVASLYEQLDQLERTKADNDRARQIIICLLRDQGESLRSIATHTSLSHTAIRRIIGKEFPPCEPESSPSSP
jgi:lambda repressor-like predicted transcriptional regulator